MKAIRDVPACLLAAAIALAGGPPGAAEPPSAPEAGLSAEYRLAPDAAADPGAPTAFRIRISPDSDHEALELLVAGADATCFTARWDGTGLRALLRDRPPGPDCAIQRYRLRDRHGHEFEFADAHTDRPYLPYLQSAGLLLPACLDAAGLPAPVAGFLGRRYERREAAATAPAAAPPPAWSTTPTVLRLDADVLIGTSRNFKNRDPGRRRAPGADYAYVDFTRADYLEMAQAGINTFDRVSPAQFAAVHDLPAFFDVDFFDSGTLRLPVPEVFFFSTFAGAEDFLDEPAYLLMGELEALGPDALTPEEVARRLERRVAQLVSVGGPGRAPTLNRRLAAAGIRFPGIELPEPELPIWEEHFSTACYQLRNGGSGIIHEGRYDLPYVPGILNETYRTAIPATPDSLFRIYFAFLRGAARVYGKDWGTSIYGQADREHAPQGLRMAYDRGARYLWFWSSDQGHHLPYEEQLALAREIRDYIRDHPRPARAGLVRGARAAIVLPYGFTFSISDWTKSRPAPLWQLAAFPIEQGRSAAGPSFYAVLKRAAERMEELLAAGVEFDVVVDLPEVKVAGYETLYYVLDEAGTREDPFPDWILWRRQLLAAGLAAFLLLHGAIWSIARRRARVRTALERPLVRCLTAPWRLVLPGTLALAFEVRLAAWFQLQILQFGMPETPFDVRLFAVAALALAALPPFLYWRRHLRNGRWTGLAFLLACAIAFGLELELLLRVGGVDLTG
ncbi:MAG: hypothetical protein HZA54_14075 [Planctomycetes bacterium]|nr:hypothetical protein [Planctomycetota bacterium]